MRGRRRRSRFTRRHSRLRPSCRSTWPRIGLSDRPRIRWPRRPHALALRDRRRAGRPHAPRGDYPIACSAAVRVVPYATPGKRRARRSNCGCPAGRSALLLATARRDGRADFAGRAGESVAGRVAGRGLCEARVMGTPPVVDDEELARVAHLLAHYGGFCRGRRGSKVRSVILVRAWGRGCSSAAGSR